MCFSIPLKVSTIQGNIARLEDGREVSIQGITVNEGMYVRVVGNMVVDTLSTKDGERIQKLILDLSRNHDV